MSALSDRMQECPMRRQAGCGLIDMALGWNAGLSLKDCDRCWNAGRETEEASRIRNEIVSLTVDGVASNIERFGGSPLVLLTVLTKHISPERAKAVLLSQATELPFTTAIAASRHLGIEAEVRELLGERSGEAAAINASEADWQSVRVSWDQATSYAVSRLSAGLFRTHRVSDEIAALRRRSCFGDATDIAKHPPCAAVWKDMDGFHYCGRCRCGKRAQARLDGDQYAKLEYPILNCPLKREGFSNFTPITISSDENGG